ncbi:MAG: crossover junction endodeoxyribonuclease RuvC [Gammaproteobacteria bacterium]|nr:crossover junction endodeoxyribonuclease RuvC [Gammaproteobacteria bacterium]MBU1656364.1 crossover junction endodeoxyribonuclease RuvC [Gammaproteobacteria bacterium]MBU1959710.1 crossover junction endodeoxyribonuclease RuvC [Gammaproteobacteria bacterium]
MSTETTRILGIDAGLRITGFGVIEKVGNKLSYVSSGCIKSNAASDLPARLGTIFAGLSELLALHQSDQVAMEKVFVNVNPRMGIRCGPCSPCRSWCSWRDSDHFEEGAGIHNASTRTHSSVPVVGLVN